MWLEEMQCHLTVLSTIGTLAVLHPPYWPIGWRTFPGHYYSVGEECKYIK